ncbi:MAG: L,D-transpeptidase family protein [Sulfuricurvum sp.]|uniref:L,D-transpeptidase family protein n=1 Tax=Sulfuricurvum sp. TaxID=2025608 RepID=UPI002637C268|nr:L,D-transpeptidase family protein [Sulfuricurvum sp.]MDD5161242.1 L,D-transpeptidase family protein [Sulfuricurvum sp.]
MKTSILTLARVFAIAIFLLSSSAWSDEIPPPFCAQLIELKKSPRFDRLTRAIETAQFYNRRCEGSESIAWLDENGTLTPDATELLDTIDRSYDEGLNPQRYHRDEISQALEQLKNNEFIPPESLFWLDILLSDAYMTLAKDLNEGLSEWDELRSYKTAKGEKFEWDRPSIEPISYPEYLAEYLKFHRIARSLTSLSPDYEEYRRLRDALHAFRSAAANEPGKINGSTSQKLIEKLLINLDRFRWLPRGIEKNGTYIDVNIPSFTLRVVDHGYEILRMKTIVGRSERPTPILYSKISYAVLNPSWTAPQTIIRKDILESKDISAFLQSHDIRVYERIGGELYEVDPSQIDWSLYAGKKQSPYTFKTDAGDTNPLGKVKFLFPNSHFVYLHGTNTPALFKKTNRALSSGCIRLSSPQKLYDYLMDRWENPVDKNTDTPEEPDTSVHLQKKLPIFLRYMTISADQNSTVTVYNDIYGYDEAQWAILKKKGVRGE